MSDQSPYISAQVWKHHCNPVRKSWDLGWARGKGKHDLDYWWICGADWQCWWAAWIFLGDLSRGVFPSATAAGHSHCKIIPEETNRAASANDSAGSHIRHTGIVVVFFVLCKTIKSQTVARVASLELHFKNLEDSLILQAIVHDNRTKPWQACLLSRFKVSIYLLRKQIIQICGTELMSTGDCWAQTQRLLSRSCWLKSL